jgi:hypothetical protein
MNCLKNSFRQNDTLSGEVPDVVVDMYVQLISYVRLYSHSQILLVF